MKGNKKHEWIDTGYQVVSENSFTQVNVESLARVMNKNKSSFYYYFGDWAGFEDALLEHHMKLAKQFADEVSSCQNIIPEMVNLFIKHKTDIFFHKQLRINREQPAFKKCFESVFAMFEHAVHDSWVSFLKLEEQSFLATKFLALISENFLLRITHENYNYTWVKNYLLETANLMQNMSSPKKT